MQISNSVSNECNLQIANKQGLLWILHLPYHFILKTKRQKRRVTERNLSSAISFLKCLWCLGQARPGRHQKLRTHLRLFPYELQGPKYLNFTCCLSVCISRKLDVKQRTWIEAQAFYYPIGTSKAVSSLLYHMPARELSVNITDD